jgi:hypothetical protein
MSGKMRYGAVPGGQAMQQHRWSWKICPQDVSGPLRERLLCTGDIPKIRKLLRTDASLEDICAELSVSVTTMRSFIKRRQICNLKDRRNFISLQKSLAKEPAE